MLSYNIVDEGVGSRRKWRGGGAGSQIGNESVVGKNSGNSPVSHRISVLEVGDPVDGVAFTATGANNNFTYHLQDLVFLPYFGANPSTSYMGWLTFENNPENRSYCSSGG